MRIFLYCPLWFGVDYIEGDDHVNERELLLASFVAAHEQIAGQYTLYLAL